MEIANKTLSVIEEALYKREIASIQTKIEQVGEQLVDVFRPYYNHDKGIGLTESKQESEEVVKAFDEFIEQGMSKRSYERRKHFSSSASELVVYPKLPPLPDAIKLAILAQITVDFVERVESIKEIAADVQGR